MKSKLIAFATTLFLSFSVPVFAEDSQKMDKVNVNQASVQQLDEKLVGVGRSIAQEIVRFRDTHGPFQSFEDLDKVKYVGAKLLEKNKARIVFE